MITNVRRKQMKGIKVIDVGSNPEKTQFGTYVLIYLMEYYNWQLEE